MKALIFDLDGVLVFTDKYHYKAWKMIADKLGIPFDEKKNNRLRGVSRMESLNIILENSTYDFSLEEKEILAEEKNEYYRKLLGTMTPGDVSPEVRKTLKELRSRGHKLAIGSSSRNTKYILEKVELEDYFDAVSDGTNITRSKPDPEVFEKAAEFILEDPHNCIVVEDARAGVDAGKAAGMTVAGIGEASAYEKTDYPIDSFAELLNIN
ncbi:beta-phosphoglucomutase [Butyrivibrio sp. AE3004]|uniref:beta-phosphoglucomutase n=1 Tax=Butyrivibrio sp. AE3004 TaxID=1506994 RepID=UPI000494B948|nr:beta-phosphoglucomutase [Butyrivibrio sp. AE3004]